MSDKEKRDFLLKKMDVNENSFFYFAAKGVADCIIESTPIKTIEDMMDDYGYGNSVLAFLGVGVRFTNEPLLDPLFCHKNQWLPKIVDFAPEVDESGIGVIVLNHATSLTSLEQGEIIAWSSSTS